ncbi:MAG: HEPN domain-containing protein [Gaiellaceae bacterium]
MSPDAEAGSDRWLEYAQTDVHAAGKLAELGLSAGAACFLAQQAVEKALKAVLVRAGSDVPRIHNLDTLRNVLPGDWAVKQDFPDLAELTAWAIESRYPGDWPQPSTENARAAVELARAVVESISDELARRAAEDTHGEG